MESTKNSYSIFDDLAASILKASRVSAASRIAPDDIKFLEQADYARPLRRALARAEVRQIIAEARNTVWPRLNAESVKLVSPKEFTRHWSGLGVQFQLARLKGAEGLELLGFYVRKMGGSRLPLICVNTAHHPAAVGATFTHEMGHHLTGRLFDSGKEHAQLLANTAYREHLDDPEELAADLLVSLGIFPGPIARNILLKPAGERESKPVAHELTDSASAAMLSYMERRYGLGFGEPDSSTRKLQYLAALVHFAKLRHALLTEYDI